MGMHELTEWLIHIEQLAGNLYRGAARVFKDDERLAGFLRHLAEEEEQHGIVMGKVAGFLQKDKGRASAIALDEVTRDRIEAPFLDCGSKMGSGSLKREHIINCIVAAEFSEWNDIFVYVLNTLKDAGQEFAVTAKIMRTHRQHIERFIGSLPEGEVYKPMMRRLPAVWQPRILVVEDYFGVRDLLSAVLSTEGAVETAENGKEALDKVQNQYFDVIVSDVDMPVMDGLRFFTEALRLSPGIGARFLFLTGNPSEETLEFIGKNRLRYLHKPMHIQELQSAVGDLLEREPAAAQGGHRSEGHRKKS
jgi:CheY-like chemotaxis protein